jgi:hypothetical protein
MKNILLTLAIVLNVNVYAQDNILSWNVESGGNDPQYISSRLSELQDYHLIGLCEVYPDNIEMYTIAAGQGESGTFASISGTTGRSDRLVIIYNQDKFKLLDYSELHYINIDETVRSPLFAHFKEISSGTEFMFMVNHLARGDRRNGRENRRYIQSQLLATWFAQQTVPIIAVGDYNFDLDIDDPDHNPAFDAFTYGNHIHWLYPEKFIRTHCNTNYDAALLDFAFVSKNAFRFNPKCYILEHPDDCLIEEKNSDHRAIKITAYF